MSEDLEIRSADENMQKFFEQLLDLKQWLKEAAENTRDSLLHEAYEKLHAIIKEDKS